MTVSAALWGTILGSMLAGIPGDKWGRRDSLRAMAVLYLVSALGCALAWNWFALVLFRFIRPDSRATGAKLEPYECGIPAEGDARGRYSVRRENGVHHFHRLYAKWLESAGERQAGNSV